MVQVTKSEAQLNSEKAAITARELAAIALKKVEEVKVAGFFTQGPAKAAAEAADRAAKLAAEEAVRLRAIYVAEATAAGKKFIADNTAEHKTSKQVIAEERAATQAVVEPKKVKEAVVVKPLGFTEGAAHEVNKLFFSPAKRKAVQDVRVVRESTPAFKQAQLEAEKARLAAEQADKVRLAAEKVEIDKAHAELLAHPKKAVAFNVETDAEKPKTKPQLDLGSVDRPSVAQVKAKLDREPTYAASTERNPLYRDLGFKRKSVGEVYFDMNNAQSYKGELGLFKSRKAAAKAAEAQLHVDPSAPKLGM